MSLDKKITDTIAQQGKIALIPFANSMYGGERTKEELDRLEKTHYFWGEIFWQTNMCADILCAGGLPNRFGITLAADMAEFLKYLSGGVFDDHIIIGEQESTHTAQQIKLMRSQILACDYKLIIPISNRWHLQRIRRYFKLLLPEVPILPVISEFNAPRVKLLSRMTQEYIMYLMTFTIDRDGTLFDRDSARRIHAASAKP